MWTESILKTEPFENKDIITIWFPCPSCPQKQAQKRPVLVHFQISLAYCGQTMFHDPERKHHFEISLAYCEWTTFVGFSETKRHWMGGQSSDDPYLSTWVLLRHLAICMLFEVFSQWTRVCVPLGAARDLTSIWFLQRKQKLRWLCSFTCNKQKFYNLDEFEIT